MTTQKSYLVSPEPLESIYDFLDLCEQILIAAFKHPDNNRLHLRQLDNIDQQCQAVQMMFVDELFKTSFTREDRSRILREFNAYLDDVLSWFQDAVQNGNMNRVTLSRLRKTRGTIFTEFISAERHAALAADSRTAEIIAEVKRKTQQPPAAAKVEVEFSRFSESKHGRGSKLLLENMAVSSVGVKENVNMYGKQPQNVKDMLKRNGYEELAKCIHARKGYIRFNPPTTLIIKK